MSEFRSIYSFNPEQALDLILRKPNAFILLGLIAFKLAHKIQYPRLEENEVYFSESDLNMMGYQPVLTPSQYRTALNYLVRLGFIEVSKDPLLRGLRIIKLLVNPFAIQGGSNG